VDCIVHSRVQFFEQGIQIASQPAIAELRTPDNSGQ
jgi:hypothetical protein